MKPWFVIFLGASLFILLGCYGQFYLNSKSNTLAHQLNMVQSALTKRHWHDASTKIKMFEKSWSQTRKLWALLTHHQEIDYVDQSLVKTREAIAGHSYADARMELETVRHFIRHIADRERFSLVNVF